MWLTERAVLVVMLVSEMEELFDDLDQCSAIAGYSDEEKEIDIAERFRFIDITEEHGSAFVWQYQHMIIGHSQRSVHPLNGIA